MSLGRFGAVDCLLSVGTALRVMAPRRSPQGNPSNTQDSLSPGSPVAPRSTSPSSGLTQFLSKPVKWFSRSASTSKVNPSLSSEPRSSLSFGGRKHKISQPTHPRPLLDSYGGQSTRYVPSKMTMSFFHASFFGVTLPFLAVLLRYVILLSR